MKTYRKSQNSMFLFGMRATTLVAVLALVPDVGLRAVQAVHIFDRATLNATLGFHQILEDFESFNIGSGDATNLDVTVLNEDTIANNQGPGLVEPGAVYKDPSAGRLQWNGDDYYDLETKTILSNGYTGDIEILYTTDVRAMGLDLRAYIGYPYTGTVDVYDLSNSLVSSTNFTLASGGTENVFFGWQHEVGIGRVVVQSSAFSWSPIIDNHGYGVPEPCTIALLGLGGLALLRKRKLVLS